MQGLIGFLLIVVRVVHADSFASDALTIAATTVPGWSFESAVTGRLVERDDDVATVAIDRQHPGRIQISILVLSRDASGTYRLLDRSESWPHDERGEIWLEIAKGSLFVHETHGDRRVSSVHVHQLRFESGEFRLIGRESASFFHGDDPEPGEIERSERQVSVNFLTGKIIRHRANASVEQREKFPRITLRTLHQSNALELLWAE